MSITSITNNTQYQPTSSPKVDSHSANNSEKYSDTLQLSDYAKDLLANSRLQSESKEENDESDVGKETVQISSSVGRVSRVSGLQREDVAALYRSIDNLT